MSASQVLFCNDHVSGKWERTCNWRIMESVVISSSIILSWENFVPYSLISDHETEAFLISFFTFIHSIQIPKHIVKFYYICCTT